MMNDGNHPLFLLEKLFGENSDAIIKNFHKLQKDLTQTCLSVKYYNSLNMKTGKCCDSNNRAVLVYCSNGDASDFKGGPEEKDS